MEVDAVMTTTAKSGPTLKKLKNRKKAGGPTASPRTTTTTTTTTTRKANSLQVIDVPLRQDQPLSKKQARDLVKLATDPKSLLNRLTGESAKSASANAAAQSLGPISIKGSAAVPTAVVISNLEQGTRREDLEIALGVLKATILSCQIRSKKAKAVPVNNTDTRPADSSPGISALVVFSTAVEARECVKKFNGVKADNRTLSVVIQGPAKPSQAARAAPLQRSTKHPRPAQSRPN